VLLSSPTDELLGSSVQSSRLPRMVRHLRGRNIRKKNSVTFGLGTKATEIQRLGCRHLKKCITGVANIWNPNKMGNVMRSRPAKQIIESGVWKHAEIRETTFCKSSWWYFSTHIRDMKAIWDHNNQSLLMISPLLQSYHVIVYHIPIEVRCYPLCVYRHAYMQY